MNAQSRMASQLLVAALLLATFAAKAPGQNAHVISLDTINAASTTTRFLQIESVRELLDGTVIVLDRRDRKNLVSWVDFKSGAVGAIGRVGAGPEEYQRPRSLARGPSATTWISDLALQRWLKLDGTITVSSIRADRSPIRELGMVLSGGDTEGHVLAVHGINPVAPLPALAHAESLLVLLGTVSDGRVDTIARMKGVSAKLQQVQFADTLGTSLTSNPLLVPDQALLVHDSWVLVAHQSPFRVDWRRPDGTWIYGPIIEKGRHRLTDRDKRAAMIDRYDSRAANTPVSVFDDWPPEAPAFLDDALSSTPEGCVVIRRAHFGTTGRVTHDVIDRAGTRVAVLQIGGMQRIVGVGAHGVYVSTTDEDGLLQLTRFQLPKGPCLATKGS